MAESGHLAAIGFTPSMAIIESRALGGGRERNA